MYQIQIFVRKDEKPELGLFFMSEFVPKVGEILAHGESKSEVISVEYYVANELLRWVNIDVKEINA